MRGIKFFQDHDTISSNFGDEGLCYRSYLLICHKHPDHREHRNNSSQRKNFCALVGN